MPTTSQLLAFVVASLLFIQVPGPSLLFTMCRALTVGRRDALLSVVGNALGLVAQVILVAVGLGAVVAQSAAAYTLIKLAGAAWVVWLGVQAIRHRRDARIAMAAGAGTRSAESTARALRTGFIVGVTNPKTIVFFLAFLPQFTNPGAGHVGLQVAGLGILFGVMAAASDSLWALGASRAREWFARNPRRLDAMGAAGGTMMIGLGATMAASE